MADQGTRDELVEATIRTAIDEWRVQDDQAETHGVSRPEYIRRALADAGLLATTRLQELTTEVERLRDVDAEAFGSRFLIQSYDIELGRTARTLARLLTEAGISPPPEGPWHLAHRVREEFQAVVRQRDEALAALEKQQAVMAELDRDKQDQRLALAMETLGAIWLYVNWRYVSKQLTTEQKELWADAVDAFGDPENTEPKAERWWRDDFVEGNGA